MKRKVTGENGKTYLVKEKKPFYKRGWFIILAIFIVLGGIGNALSDSTPSAENPSTAKSSTQTHKVTVKENTPETTALGDVADRITGLEMGADDYIVKPFEIEELLLRTENILRLHGYKNNLLRVGDVELDAEAHIVRKAGREITLTPKEFELLHFLLRNKGVALSRFALYERVWNDGESGDTRTLDIHITRLRKKLGLENEIATVHKLGYIIREKT